MMRNQPMATAPAHHLTMQCRTRRMIRWVTLMLILLCSSVMNAQTEMEKEDVEAGFRSLEGEVRSYLLTNRHSRDKTEMRDRAAALCSDSEHLLEVVVEIYELDSVFYNGKRRLIHTSSFSHLEIPDSLKEKSAAGHLSLAEELSKPRPYWICSLLEIGRLTDELKRSRRLKSFRRLHQELSTVVPLD